MSRVMALNEDSITPKHIFKKCLSAKVFAFADELLWRKPISCQVLRRCGIFAKAPKYECHVHALSLAQKMPPQHNTLKKKIPPRRLIYKFKDFGGSIFSAMCSEIVQFSNL
jgi:hypothetical protein